MFELILVCALGQQPVAMHRGYSDAEMVFRTDAAGQKWGHHPSYGWARVIHDPSLPKGVTVAPGAQYVSGPPYTSGPDDGASTRKIVEAAKVKPVREGEVTRTPPGGHGSGTGGGNTVVANKEPAKAVPTGTVKPPQQAAGLARYNETQARMDRYEGDLTEIRTTLKRLIELMEQR